jgi:hypothetical protein
MSENHFFWNQRVNHSKTFSHHLEIVSRKCTTMQKEGNSFIKILSFQQRTPKETCISATFLKYIQRNLRVFLKTYSFNNYLWRTSWGWDYNWRWRCLWGCHATDDYPHHGLHQLARVKPYSSDYKVFLNWPVGKISRFHEHIQEPTPSERSGNASLRKWVLRKKRDHPIRWVDVLQSEGRKTFSSYSQGCGMDFEVINRLVSSQCLNIPPWTITPSSRLSQDSYHTSLDPPRKGSCLS